MVSTIDIAFTAGFIEGDGSFTGWRTYPAIVVRQCNVECLERLRGLFGGGIVSCKMSAIGKQPVFQWSLSGNRGIALAMTIYPLLSSKRQAQALRCINRWKELRGTHGETHISVHTLDQTALEAMRRVYLGEGVMEVAKDVAVHHSVLSNWLAGRWRPELLEKIKQEGVFANDVVKKRTVGPRLSDTEVLSGIRRIRQGETIKGVARDIGIGRPTLSLIVSGKNRPYLLAQVLREEAEALEEVCS